ncbi:MAG TPA: ATP-dependent 6-phosphofructokinase [Opitutaceae bacterium]
MKNTKRIGILTAGGDAPGLNAAIRAVGKTAIGGHGWEVVGFLRGFTGLIEDQFLNLDARMLSGILTAGGTILGTSRVKVHRVDTEAGERDMRDEIVATYQRHHLDALVCIGGGGTHKNALRLAEKGLKIVTLPKTIDNDVACTDDTIGFDTAIGIATEALDRLHSTAHSHHRIIVAEIMGHRAGWLTLGAGIAGGADVILIPEIPYDVRKVAAAINRRSKGGSRFSIVAVAEGAMSVEHANKLVAAVKEKTSASNGAARARAKRKLRAIYGNHAGNTMRLATQLESLTHLEARVTILGYVQRGGTPSCSDRLLATRLGATAVEMIRRKRFGVMIASDGDDVKPVPIAKVAGNLKSVPLDHRWIESGRRVDTSFGD